MAVTPTGVDYAALRPEDIPVVDLDGEIVDGSLKPTSELPMHLTVYRKAADPEGKAVAGVVHTHSVHATAVSTLTAEVPPIHYMLAAIGPSARVAAYATYGTEELAEAMLVALEGRRGCLLARAAGTPNLLPPAEIEHVVESSAVMASVRRRLPGPPRAPRPGVRRRSDRRRPP